MPLTNNVIIKLNEITTFVEDKEQLSHTQINEIKKIFNTLLENGERYDVDDIEYWFENEGSWKNKNIRVRLTNLAHYIQDKYDQTIRLRMLSTDDSCSCGN